MVLEMLFNLIFSPVLLLLNALPVIGFTINTSWLDTLSSVIQTSSYFLPILALLPILTISFALEAFNLAWKLILRIKSFIPTMGA